MTAVALALFLAAGRASAQVSPHGNLSLDWRAPANCPDGAAVSERVQSLLTSSAAATEPVQARGSVTAPAPGGAWQLTLETVQGARTWQRSISASSCEELTDAGALIIALVIDPNLQTTPATKSAPVLSAAPAPAAPGVNAAPPTAEPNRDQILPNRPEQGADLTAHVAASAVGDWGSLPKPAAGMQVAGGFGLRPLELEVVGIVLPETREEIAQNPERGGYIDLLAGGLRGCYVVEWAKLCGRGCGALEAGRMQGSGFGATSWIDTQSALWIAGRLGVLAGYAVVGPLALRLGVEALVPLTRPEFVLENLGRVHRPAPVIGRLELGLELLFR